MKKRLWGIIVFIMILAITSSALADNPYGYWETFTYNGVEYTVVRCTYIAWQLAYERCGVSLPAWGNAGTWLSSAQNARLSTGSDARANSIAVYNGVTGWGHVAFVDSVENNGTMTLTEGGIPGYGGNARTQSGWSTTVGTQKYDGGDYLQGFIYLTETRGSELSTGAGQTLPDGDYLIACAASDDKSKFYYLDIAGDNAPADQTNVQLWGPVTEMPQQADIWTIQYNSSDKFYTIKQKGTDVCLDVYCGDTLAGTNVWACSNNGSNAQKWSIARRGDGYELRPKCSGGGDHPMCLDVDGGKMEAGRQVRTWVKNDSLAQTWLFIPYRPAQPIDEGRYVLLYNANKDYELDVSGDSGDIPVDTNVQIWNNNAPSQFNSFDFIKLSNGYYKIRHSASGMCLDVSGGASVYKTNVVVYPDNGSPAQQWAVVPNDTGYNLIAKCNGYCLDLPGGETGDKKNVEVYPWMNNKNQRWSFVKAEYTIAYDLNGGSDGPDDQIKYFNKELTLSTVIPRKAGHTFVRWDFTEPDVISHFAPGDTVIIDQDMLLTAVWKTNDYTLSYDGNGGDPVPAAQQSAGEAVVIPSGVGNIPSRSHYIFRGWAESSTAEVAEYAPGDTYSKGISTTLYAVWERSYEHIFALPAGLTEIDDEAFLNTNADVIVVPATVTRIGENAFGDVVIYGFAGSRTESYADENHLTFVPITSGWVLESEMPNGAHVTDEKWRYMLTTTNMTTSTESSLEGWTQAGFEWEQSGTGIHKYASYPAGIPDDQRAYSGNQLPGEKIEGNHKRVAGEPMLYTYVYWHWTYVDSVSGDLASGDYNVPIEDARKEHVQTGTVYRDYFYFDAFESQDSQGTVGPRKPTSSNPSNTYDFGPDGGFYYWRGINSDASQWWWRYNVNQQSYTDYQKVYTYVQNASEILESDTEVQPGDGISNVQRWVKYGF